MTYDGEVSQYGTKWIARVINDTKHFDTKTAALQWVASHDMIRVADYGGSVYYRKDNKAHRWW